MGKIKIIIPSADRAKTVYPKIPGQILCVPENQVDQYKEHNDCEILTHPKIKGLALKRQWILNKCGSVFMIDDDITKVERVYTTDNKHAHMNWNEAEQRIQETYQTAKQAGIYLFGFNDTPNPKHYKPFKPIQLTGYINASAFGIIKNDKLFFTKETTAAESHWLTLLNAYHYRKCYIDNRYHFRQKLNSTFTLDGGQAMNRTLESEKNDTMYLKRMFGDAVQIKKGQKDGKRLHKYQRTIKIPF